MKKLAVVFVIIILCTTGCSQPANYLVDYHVQNQFSQMRVTMCETENAYYGMPVVGSFMMYMDKETGFAGILCGRAECMHDNKQCNGYLSGRCTSVAVYEEKLYWVEGIESSILYCMTLDGTNRQMVCELEKEEGRDVLQRVFHRGYVYTLGVVQEVQNGAVKQKLSLIGEKIGQEEKMEIYSEVFENGDWYAYYQIQIIENKLYLMLSGHRKNYETHSLGLYEWDFETRKMNVLLEQMDIGFTSYNMNIKENCIYIGADGNEISNGGSLYQFNMTTKELSQVWSVENFGRIELGDSIAFMTAWNAEGKTMIRAMDYEGNVLLDSVLSVEDLGNDSGYGRVFCGGNQDVGYYELQGRDGFITIRVPVSGQGKAQILWKGKGLT